MNSPHVLRIIQVFELGETATLKFAVQGLEVGAKAYLYESNTKYEWTQTHSAVQGNYLLVTSVPQPNPNYRPFTKPHPALDGGGDGTTTVIVTNPDGTDPAPPTFYTMYVSPNVPTD